MSSTENKLSTCAECGPDAVCYRAEPHGHMPSVHGTEIEALSSEPETAKKGLSLLDRLLTLWILLAMVLGILIGYFSPSSADRINSWTFGSTDVNIPIAIGLILMMWPPLARVKYNEVMALICKSDPCTEATNNGQPSRSLGPRMLGLSLALNWIVGPFLMFLLAIACLPDHGDYVRGLVYTGLARCIAMVIVWNSLSSGSNEFVAILVALNSLFQIIVYSPYAYLFTALILPSVGIAGSTATVSFLLILQSVAIYLGIPFLLGFGCWLLLPRLKSRTWYETQFTPFIAPLTLVALLFTIIIIFCLKGQLIATVPLDILRIIVPLLAYFLIMFGASLFVTYRFGLPYEESITLAFTAASNNFELSIAVSVAVFGLNSGEALACVVGPLVEVPVMLALVHVARWAKSWWPSNPA